VPLTALAKKMGLDKSSVHHRVRKAIERGYLVNREEKRGMSARIALADPLPDEIEILPDPEVLECWSDDGGVKEGEETEEGGESEAEQPSPFIPPNQHSNTPTPHTAGDAVPSDYDAVIKELAAQAVPVDRRGCDYCGLPADNQPLRLCSDGERQAWLHRRCEVPWFSSKDRPLDGGDPMTGLRP
jgi:hypothetical protein